MRNPFRRPDPLPPLPSPPLPIATEEDERKLAEIEARQRRLRELIAEEEAALYRSFYRQRPAHE